MKSDQLADDEVKATLSKFAKSKERVSVLEDPSSLDIAEISSALHRVAEAIHYDNGLEVGENKSDAKETENGFQETVVLQENSSLERVDDDYHGQLQGVKEGKAIFPLKQQESSGTFSGDCSQAVQLQREDILVMHTNEDSAGDMEPGAANVPVHQHPSPTLPGMQACDPTRSMSRNSSSLTFNIDLLDAPPAFPPFEDERDFVEAEVPEPRFDFGYNEQNAPTNPFQVNTKQMEALDNDMNISAFPPLPDYTETTASTRPSTYETHQSNLATSRSQPLINGNDASVAKNLGSTVPTTNTSNAASCQSNRPHSAQSKSSSPVTDSFMDMYANTPSDLIKKSFSMESTLKRNITEKDDDELDQLLAGSEALVSSASKLLHEIHERVQQLDVDDMSADEA
jgi:hypothetical protein